MNAKKINGLTVTISSDKGWDEYAMNHPASSFFHLYGWGEAFKEVFGFRNIYLEAVIDNKICGILPLILAKTASGRSLISIPIGIYAGALADNELIEQALIERAKELTKEFGCGYLELRNLNRKVNDLPSKDLYVTFIKKLPERPEECLALMPQHARAAARHAINEGLTFDVGLSYLEECYKIYAINQKELGSPVVSRKWFNALVRLFKGKTNILVVKSGNRCIASVLTFFYKDTVLPFYGACIPGFFSLNPNNYMYLKLQEYGVEKGYKLFDFGRSRKDAGTYHFKINQGFEPMQLYYQYYLHKAKRIPEISPSNKSFNLAKKIWSHLPLCITKFLGPKVFKYVMP
jgi:FemAB-related protein (PEP-CTERM system-associated)